MWSSLAEKDSKWDYYISLQAIHVSGIHTQLLEIAKFLDEFSFKHRVIIPNLTPRFFSKFSGFTQNMITPKSYLNVIFVCF